MTSIKSIHALAVCAIVGGALPMSATARDCANACTPDEVITTEVTTSLQQHPELATPKAIRVQTHNQVVYLYGHVGTGLQRDDAISLAQRVPNVKKVISSIRTGNSGS
jgi:osmotically-inducible protein OsmY